MLSEPISFTVHKDSNMRPKPNCNISKVYKERGGRKKETQRRRLGKTDTTKILPSLPPPHCLSHTIWRPPPNPPTPHYCIISNSNECTRSRGRAREGLAGGVLQGIWEFKMYTAVFLLWVIRANNTQNNQQVVKQSITQLHTVCWYIPDVIWALLTKKLIFHSPPWSLKCSWPLVLPLPDCSEYTLCSYWHSGRYII